VPETAFKQVTDRANTVNSPDGAIMSIPRSVPMANDRELMMVRGDWMEAVGVNEITSLAEFKTYLGNITGRNGIGMQGASPTPGFNAYSPFDGAFLLREFAPNFFFPTYTLAGARPIYIDISQEPYTVKSFYHSPEFQALVGEAEVLSAFIAPGGEALGFPQIQRFNQNLTGAFIEYSTTNIIERIDAFKQAPAIPAGGTLRDAFITKRSNGDIIPKVMFRGIDNMMVALSKSDHTEEFVDFFNWTKNQENHDLVCYGILGRNYYLTPAGRITFTNPANPSQMIPLNMRYSDNMAFFGFNDIKYIRFPEGLTQDNIDQIKNWEGEDENGEPNFIISPLLGFNLENTFAYTSARNRVAAAEIQVPGLVTGWETASRVLPNGKTVSQDLFDRLGDPALTSSPIGALIAETQRQLNAWLALQ